MPWHPGSSSRATRAAAKPAHRFQAFYVPNGMAMEYWTPDQEEGTGFDDLADSWSRSRRSAIR